MTDPTPLASAAGFIRTSDRLAIVSHVNPDADALGSILGLALGLRRLGKQTYPMLSDPVPDYAMFLPGAEEIRHDLPADGFDAAIFADAAGIDRAGTIYTDDPSRFDALPILNIDHHQTNPMFGTVNYVDGRASSTSELAYHLLRALDIPIDAATATPLLFGIVGDTGSFRNGATTPGALKTAAELVALGGDTQRIAFQLFECKTFAAARVWGRIVGSARLDRERRIVFARLSQDMLREEGASADETEGVPEYLRGIEEAEVVMLLKETPEGDQRVSMRSRPGVDVSAIAAIFGGGGHRQAAGCTIPGAADLAEAALIAAFDEVVGSRF